MTSREEMDMCYSKPEIPEIMLIIQRLLSNALWIPFLYLFLTNYMRCWIRAPRHLKIRHSTVPPFSTGVFQQYDLKNRPRRARGLAAYAHQTVPPPVPVWYLRDLFQWDCPNNTNNYHLFHRTNGLLVFVCWRWLVYLYVFCFVESYGRPLAIKNT